MSNPKLWKSLHIYYEGEYNDLLFEIEKIVNRFNISFFFIRYWEKGNHIRLRLRTKSIYNLIRIKTEIEQFLDKNPSKRDISKFDYLKIATNISIKQNEPFKNHSMEKNDSVSIECYDPEYGKYINQIGMVISESEFIYSSQHALEILKKKLDKSRLYLYSAIFMFNLIELLPINKNEKKYFIINYKKYWLSFCNQKEIDYEKWEKYCNKITSKIGFANYTSIGKNKKEFYEKKFILIDRLFNQDQSYGFLFNYIHLFNNRIGIKPNEEILIATLCYLIEEKYGK